MSLSAIFYPCHFIPTILSIPFCPIPFGPYTILSIPFCLNHFVRIPFCPYHFVRYHFVLEPLHLMCDVFHLMYEVLRTTSLTISKKFCNYEDWLLLCTHAIQL